MHDNPELMRLVEQNRGQLSALAPRTPAFQKIGHTFGELQELDLAEPEFVIRGLCRGQTGLLCGVTNKGKTTLARNLLLSLACGREFKPFTEGGKPMRVALIDEEDGQRRLRDDLNTMVLGLSAEERRLVAENLFIICDVEGLDVDLKLNDPLHFELVARALTEHRTAFFIVETISKLFVIRNENDNVEVKEEVTNTLNRLAKRTNAADLAVHHIGKSKQEDGTTKEPAHRGRGASSFADQAKLIFNVERNGANDKTILTCAKIKGRGIPDVVLALDEETRWFSIEEEVKMRSSYDVLIDLFSDGVERTTAEVLESLKGRISQRSVMANLAQAVKCNKLEKLKHGIYRLACILGLENESA